jgi:hypothetical protein
VRTSCLLLSESAAQTANRFSRHERQLVNETVQMDRPRNACTLHWHSPCGKRVLLF